ncbi:Bowman-Birk type bran trypsin inhibitor-like [Oryza brachyantha]|uniref:Bowman-Birk type bran trypsin inhibitor-like n=1 Tax=Oryza brachyantha TaxID=4533 RepID=UPI001AD9AB0E|nr:Bowman-Birk type bran trypsin inhibitor-like [Oryza brachyantha]
MKVAMATSMIFFFLLAGAAGEASSDDIRLSGDGGAAEQQARPWKCCDNIEKLPEKIFPPRWRCNDELEASQCVDACAVCREAPGPFPGPLICDDVYWGVDPGPLCTERPWGSCCDRAFCTKTNPPTCRCADEVASCAAACKDCQPVESSEPPRYVCQDQFTGQPGPSCTPDAYN